MRPPRLGHIQYLNCYPLYFGLVEKKVLLDVELVKGTPAELARRLRKGSLDLAPVPSMEYLVRPEKYFLLPDLCVSSHGAAKSILLVSKVRAERIAGPVALSNTSLTSAVLVRILLDEVWGVRPASFRSPPNLPRMLEEAEAALLIGDEALRLQASLPPGLHVYDLGEIWQEFTGLPMVFAVWAVRREFARAEPGLLKEVAEALRVSLSFGLKHLEEAALKASRWEPFSPGFVEAYFRGLGYSFGEAERKGLLLFAEKAAARGYLRRVPELELVEVEDGAG